MPGGDGRGPLGEGAISGRGLGNCVQFSEGVRRGMGRSFGRGRMCSGGRQQARGRMFRAEDQRISERSYLEREARALAFDLKEINERLRQLETRKQTENEGDAQ